MFTTQERASLIAAELLPPFYILEPQMEDDIKNFLTVVAGFVFDGNALDINSVNKWIDIQNRNVNYNLFYTVYTYIQTGDIGLLIGPTINNGSMYHKNFRRYLFENDISLGEFLLVVSDNTLYRLDPDTLLLEILGSTNGQINDVIVYPHNPNDIVVAGDFTQVDGLNIPYLAVYNTNTYSWRSIGTPDDAVHCIMADTVQSIYIGGDFNNINGNSSIRVASYNFHNSSWTNFPVGLNNRVNSIVQSNNAFYFGGAFTSTSDNNVISPGVIKLQSGSWSPVGIANQLSGTVNALAVVGDDVIVAGRFDFQSTGNLVAYNSITATEFRDLTDGLNNPLFIFPNARGGVLKLSTLGIHDVFVDAGDDYQFLKLDTGKFDKNYYQLPIPLHGYNDSGETTQGKTITKMCLGLDKIPSDNYTHSAAYIVSNAKSINNVLTPSRHNSIIRLDVLANNTEAQGLQDPFQRYNLFEYQFNYDTIGNIVKLIAYTIGPI